MRENKNSQNNQKHGEIITPVRTVLRMIFILPFRYSSLIRQFFVNTTQEVHNRRDGGKEIRCVTIQHILGMCRQLFRFPLMGSNKGVGTMDLVNDAQHFASSEDRTAIRYRVLANSKASSLPSPFG